MKCRDLRGASALPALGHTVPPPATAPADRDYGQPLPGEPVRLQKLIAAAGLGSRRGAEEYLRAGRVTVNGKPAHLGDSANPRRDVVAVDGEPLEREKAAYWLLHKPQGVVTTLHDPLRRRTVADLLPPAAGPSVYLT
jgi:16S rRNA U516 pseudouridylate synthase RsuA-like enzyme